MSRRRAEPVDLSAYQFTSSDMDRFFDKIHIDHETGCWNWKNALCSHGLYGQFSIKHRRVRAHKAIYVSCYGPVPAGYEVDHECGNPSCVNPSHLRAITKLENLKLRGWIMAGGVRCAKRKPRKISKRSDAVISHWDRLPERMEVC